MSRLPSTWSKKKGGFQLDSTNLKVGVIVKQTNCFITAIKSIIGGSKKDSEMQLTKEGLRIFVEDPSRFQVRGIFLKHFFSMYQYNEEDDKRVSFGIDMSIFLDYVTNLSDSDYVKFKLFYYGDHRPIVFTFMDNEYVESTLPVITPNANSTAAAPTQDEKEISVQNVQPGSIYTECFTKIKQSIEPIDYDSIIKNDTLMSTIVMNTSDFSLFIHEFDREVENVTVSISMERFSIQSLDTKNRKTVISIPYDKENPVLISSEVYEASEFCYKLYCFRATFKALQLTNRIGLATYKSGLLKLQLVSAADEDEIAMFLEFFMNESISDDSIEEEIVNEKIVTESSS